ncbi:hypothetical protein RFI_35727, partial [Reticulomyxa filosa]
KKKKKKLKKKKKKGFDSRITSIKASISMLPRRQRILSRVECWERWCGFAKHLELGCEMAEMRTLDEYLELTKYLGCAIGNINIVVRAFFSIIIDQQIKVGNVLWTHKSLPRLIQESFHRQCDWARMFTNDTKKLKDWDFFFSRVQSGVRDLIYAFLLDSLSFLHTYIY